jgi:alcohol dehydrogenase class IV
MKLHTNIVQGEGRLVQLPKLLEQLGLRRIGVLCDKTLHDTSDYVSSAVATLTDGGAYLIFYDSPFEPSYQYLDRLMGDLRKRGLDSSIDGFVGIGGGSALDTAKGLALLCKNEGPSLGYKGFPKDVAKPLPVIAVPSTTGTGSEAVFNASFFDENTNVKMGINCELNYPVLTILDPHVVSTAPRSVLASSGCDALVHTLEAFVSVESTPQSRSFSSHAFSLIMQNMPPLLEAKGSLDNWANMQWAAVFAMLGLSNASSGPSGALSYYLGTHFRVAHGVAGGAFIGKVTRHNHENGYHDYGQLAGWDGAQPTDAPQERSERVVQTIEGLLALAGMPASLAELGVREEDRAGFLQFAEQAKAAFGFNPVPFSEEQIMLLCR